MLRFQAWWALLAAVLGAVAARAAEQPNVVFVLIDDAGYGDFGCTGYRDAKTANIDRLAAEGTRFTQFYVASPICSPSRVGFTTGQYPQRHSIRSYLNSRTVNQRRGMRDYLDPQAPCLARAFQQAGYATAHFGKWHMGGGRDVDDAPLPRAYGFDQSLVSFEGLGDRILPPGGLSKQSAKLGHGKINHVAKHQQTEIYVDRSIEFVRANRGRPFYLQLWLNDVHDAYAPKPELLAKYDSLSKNKYRRQYAAVIDEMDRQLGRLFATIDELGLAEQTLIVLTSDNGPTAWPRYYQEGLGPPGSTSGMRGRKWSLYEGGIRLPLVARWKGRVPAGRVDEQSVLSAVDFFPTLIKLAGLSSPAAEFDGQDVSDALLGKPLQRPRALYWQYADLQPGLKRDQSPSLAIREGRWKLLIQPDGQRRELYDLSNDHAESKNLAAEQPEIADRLAKRLLEWNALLPELEPAD